MTVKSLNAWVIHKQWSGDTSARVFFFTSEWGLVDCLCRGGRTPKKQALLQPFIPLWLGMQTRYGRHYLQQVECANFRQPLTGVSLFSALYMNELLYHVLTPLESEPELFAVYSQALDTLAAVTDRRMIEACLRRFEWVLLQAGGQAFSLLEDARSGNVINPQENYQFQAGEGLITSLKGVSGAHIIAFSRGELSDPLVLKSMKMLMRRAMDYLIGGKEIKARALWR